MEGHREDLRAEALLCPCMDFRFVGFYPRFMERLGLSGGYDQIGLAGSSLVFCGISGEGSEAAIRDQVKAARNLHRVRKVILVDHDECGAYGLLLGDELKRGVPEKDLHRTYLMKATDCIQLAFPDLAVRMFYVTVNGTFEEIM